MRIWGLSLLVSTVLGCAAVAQQPTPGPSNAWSQVAGPSIGTPEVFGFYSAGCIRGAQALPPDGIGYQSMRLYRNRQWAHPNLVQFINEFAKQVDAMGSGLLLGDIAQARGGPLPYGHASHQMGLDVDVWFWTHPEQRIRSLSMDERNNLDSLNMLNANGLVDPTKFTREQILKLKLAAADPKVERIFVNPAIKTYLCSVLEDAELPWLHKLRPWPGHNEHFHVRISCPEDSKECTKQDPVAPGDGCDELRPPRHHIDLTPGHALEKEMSPAIEKLLESSTPLPESCMKLLKE